MIRQSKLITEDTILKALSQNFKLDSFRGQQLEIIQSTLQNIDVVVLMHTG